MNTTRSAVAASRIALRCSRPLSRPSEAAQWPRNLLPKSQRRNLQSNAKQSAQAAAIQQEAERRPSPPPTNPALSFPCLDARDLKTARLSSSSGPEPSYTRGPHQTFTSHEPLLLDWGGVLPSYSIAYETWGTPNDPSHPTNAILLHTGLSASSHAHSTLANPALGWWEKFIGPGKPLDTSTYFIICTNVIGGCYGSTGPSSRDPADGRRYATRFPILTLEDMVRAQFRLLDHLGVDRLYASVGASMGGMQSLAAGVLFPERVGRVASISGCARSHPYSIAMRHTQRQVLMMDPNWNRGFYYTEEGGAAENKKRIPPHAGMKMARQIATVTYRSGPEWEMRFGRRRADGDKPPALCPDFLIETYLDHAGEKWSLEYDANSLLYVSKAMDLFDLGREARVRVDARRRGYEEALAKGNVGRDGEDTVCSLTLPEEPYQERSEAVEGKVEQDSALTKPGQHPPMDLIQGLSPMKKTPTLVMGVASDILFPAWQQKEVASALKAGGNTSVTHIELGEDVSLFGHDTFLLDVENVGGGLKAFLD